MMSDISLTKIDKFGEQQENRCFFVWSMASQSSIVFIDQNNSLMLRVVWEKYEFGFIG
jgi:hypothetical protein